MTVQCVIKEFTINVQVMDCGFLVYDMVLRKTEDYTEIMRIHARLRDMGDGDGEVSAN